jgi:hypothetical protein
MYKLLRGRNRRNPNPVHVVKDESAHATSRQIKDYLLCEDCEQRFRREGEDWTMAQCYRDGTFLLRDTLRGIAPLSANPRISVYRGIEVPGIEQLVYFGMSVFWRAAAHEWNVLGKDYQISLGPYEEPIRRYLLGETAFPDKVTLFVRVSDGEEKFLNLAYAPESGNRDGFHVHQLLIPGVLFLMLTGGRIPPNHYRSSTAPAPERFISIHPKSEENDLMAMADVVRSAEPINLD